MELNAIEIHVFVSCPRDVQQEKNSVKKICDRINANQRDIGCNISLVFRDFTEIIGAVGIRPQQAINDSIKDYNIYLGIMHMRFGTPTGEVNKNTGLPFESGTEEEFVLAYEKKQAGKEPGSVYFFFKEQKGSKTVAEISQAHKVLAFKESLISTNNSWINDFKSRHAFESMVFDLLTRTVSKLCFDKKIQIKQEHLQIGPVSYTSDFTPEINFKLFVPDFPKLDHYIYRSISQTQKVNSPNTSLFDLEEDNKELKDIVLKDKRVVLLGNAGSGKSIELQQTAKYFEDPTTPYIPIYKRFNTYTDQDIESFLPRDWKKIEENVLIIFLDGLDEVQPQNFFTAVRKLVAFGEAYPAVTIVVSCRTNFYELPDLSFSGTLTGYNTYVLNAISLKEIKAYIQSHHNFNWNSFVKEIYNESYLDLLQKPFFLSILINYYIKYGNFIGGRLKIIEDSILSMIMFDQEHFKSVDIPKSKISILTLLEKIAFVMEVMGKNFLSDDELELALPSGEDRKQIKYFSAFTKDIQKGLWMFEHNNIQEFLASRILERQTFAKLIEAITFAPDHNKVKPTWANTLSFFISTGKKETVNKLVEWLADKDYEIIVKFEPDRISKEIRLNIFKKIYNYYKEKNIWLSSNKFNSLELGRFAAFSEILDFLLNEIQNETTSRISKLNALGVLGYFNLNDFEASYSEQIRTVLIKQLDEHEEDPQFIHDILYVLADLNITDSQIIQLCTNKYSNNVNQYIRTGLYKLLSSSKELDNYVHIFIDGINTKEIKNPEGVRSTTSLSSESWQLNEGLIKMKSSHAIKRILSILKQREERRALERYHHHDVIESVFNNVLNAYEQDQSLFDDIYDIMVTAGRDYDQSYVKMLLPFFTQTGTKSKAFRKLWNDDNVRNYEKALILELLLDQTVILEFVEKYSKRDISNQDVESMYNIIQGAYSYGHPQYNLVTEFELAIANISDLKLQKRQIIDWTAIRKKKTQESFDLLFNKSALLNEIENIFNEIGENELTFNQLWEIKKGQTTSIDDYFIGSALEVVRDFTTQRNSVSLITIQNWINSNDFEAYQIDEIYEMLHGSSNDSLEISKTQIDFITEWCKKIAGNIDIEKAISQNEESSAFRINRTAILLWFFVRRFQITLPEEKLLEFTLFYSFENNNDPDQSTAIVSLEDMVNVTKIKDKVKRNLSSKIANNHVWISNAAYAINHNIKEAFPFILYELKNSTINESYRNQVLKLYFKKTENLDALQNILVAIHSDHFRWNIIDILIEHENQAEFLIQYLLKVIDNEYEPFESRMKAGSLLMKLNNTEGLKFVASQILKKKDPTLDFHTYLYSINTITDVKAIPILIKLLSLAKKPDFQKDRFNSLESNVYDALFAIGTQSEAAYLKVKIALEKFIQKNKNKLLALDFIHLNIKKIEERLYLNKSKNYTIDQAILELNRITT